jgi:hypothetical protein
LNPKIWYYIGIISKDVSFQFSVFQEKLILPKESRENKTMQRMHERARILSEERA